MDEKLPITRIERMANDQGSRHSRDPELDMCWIMKDVLFDLIFPNQLSA